MELLLLLWAVVSAYYTIILPTLAAILLGFAIYRWRHEVAYFFVRLRTGFPLIGFIARNARQLQEIAPDPAGGGTLSGRI